MAKDLQRCSWVGEDPVMIQYHDTEWGVPVHDDNKLFEFMVLDAFQAGLSWTIVLKKRAGFKAAFANFNPAKVAEFVDSDIERLLQNSAIIRNRQKILATINNAQRFLELQKRYGSFDKYIWQFTDGKILQNSWQKDADIPAFTVLSDKMSQDLQSHGFKFAGSTICYAFMQAAGMVNDHVKDCFLYPDLV